MTKAELLERVTALPDDWYSDREAWDSDDVYAEEVPPLPPLYGPKTRFETFIEEQTLRCLCDSLVVTHYKKGEIMKIGDTITYKPYKNYD
jgi:hypothetical protein